MNPAVALVPVGFDHARHSSRAHESGQAPPPDARPVMSHQSGGCCDGSAPMRYPRGEFRVGASDVLLGHVAGGTPFWMTTDQFTYWSHTHLTVDVVPGRGSGFSLEAPEGVRFLLRSHLLTDEELCRPDSQPPLPNGAAP
ncbi:DUF779 domain-containing protein [Streptomyces hawaiiensis]|uniref:DUF779 domain-containing protein n=1 Tax=Streptomyces hawaiiensis TaxID=67305 RepID=UPI003649435C